MFCQPVNEKRGIHDSQTPRRAIAGIVESAYISIMASLQMCITAAVWQYE